MKIKLTGFITGVLGFVIIFLIKPTSGMFVEASNVVLKHSQKQVVEAAGVKRVTMENLEEFLQTAGQIHVKIPKDFSKSGTRGIAISNKGTTLLDAVYLQAKGLKRTLAIAVLMGIFWITEALPIPITALIPVVFFPLFRIASPTSSSMPGYFNAFTPYMHYLIVLFIAGFTIAEAMKKWGLHERIALNFISKVGFSRRKLIFAFMVTTAFISMFISNTATTAMMMPIALAILLSMNEIETNFGKAMMLSIAYGASIGGIGTLIGTPPNVVLAGFADTLLGVKITFAGWLKIGLPVVVILLPSAFFIILKVFPYKGRDTGESKNIIREKLGTLGRMKKGEINTLVIFMITALLWIFSKQIKSHLHIPWMNDAVVGMIGVFLFYVVPVNIKKWEFTLDWKTNEKIPWGTLILFGGGIALGKALNNTGAASFIASHLILAGKTPFILLLFFVVLLVDFLTEITSNTATTNMLMPILFALGMAIGRNPLTLMIGGAVAASMAFMLPVATPPNAIVYGTGAIKIRDMVKVGIILDIVAATLWTLLLYLFHALKILP